MALVERDKELALLHSQFEECLSGAGRVVLITGTVGSGKTKLLYTFAEHAAELGARFLGAAGSSAERTLPLGVVGQLLGSANIDQEAIDRLTHCGLASPGSPGELVDVMRAVTGTLLDLAREQPLVIGIDDVHLADSLSSQCILYLVRRMRSARLLVVLDEVASPRPALPMFYAELMSQPHCRRVSLAPLSRRGVAELLNTQLDATRANRLASACLDATGGNPLLVQAVAQDQPSTEGRETRSSDQLVFGGAFGQAVVNYLYRSSPEQREVARALAVLGGPTSPTVIGRLVGVDAASADRTVAALRLGGLLNSTGLLPPRVRGAVLDDIRPSESSELHRRAAELLHADAAAPKVVAGHLLAADLFDFPWAMSTLRAAAEDALDDGEVAFATECLKLASRCCTDERERALITSVLARAEWRSDPAIAVRHYEELGEAIRQGHLIGREALTLIRGYLWFGRPDPAAEAIKRVSEAADTTDSEFATDLRFSQLWMACMYPPPVLGELIAAGSPTPAAAFANPEVHAAAVMCVVLTRDLDDGMVTRVEQVLQRSVLDDSTLAPLWAAVAALVFADELDRAAAGCDRLANQTAARNAPAWQAILSVTRATIAMRRGDLANAKECVRAAFELMSPGSWGVAVGLPLATMLLASTAAGDYAEAARQLDQPIPESMFQTTFGLPYLHARGCYYLATNRGHAALDDFQACGTLMRKWGLDVPAFLPWRADAAQAWLQLGRTDMARDLLNEQLTLPSGDRARVRGITLRLLASTTDPRSQLPMITESVAALQICGDRLELARALADMGRVQHELGEFSQARMTVRRAWHTAHECGAEALCRTLKPSLRRDPAAEQLSELDGETWTLSEAERRVAALAARGRTNREIARDLFITVSTVEQHLTRVYRKLKVNRRTDLSSRLRSEWADSA